MDKKTQHKKYIEQLHDTYIAKNSDYGDSFNDSLDEFGLLAGIIRMGDKMNRLKTLVEHEAGAQVPDESLEDTLLDLANYSIMAVMWLNRDELSSVEVDTDVEFVRGSSDIFTNEASSMSFLEKVLWYNYYNQSKK